MLVLYPCHPFFLLVSEVMLSRSLCYTQADKSRDSDEMSTADNFFHVSIKICVVTLLRTVSLRQL